MKPYPDNDEPDFRPLIFSIENRLVPAFCELLGHGSITNRVHHKLVVTGLKTKHKLTDQDVSSVMAYLDKIKNPENWTYHPH